MSSSEFAATVASRLFSPSTAIRRDAVFHGPAAETNNPLAEIRRADPAGAHTTATLETIADSGLSFEQKDALIKLTAQIDEQQEGNPSYLADVETLVNILEASADPTQQQPMTLDEARSRYEAERGFMTSNDNITLSFAMAFEQVRGGFISPQNKQEQDFLKAATAQDIAKAFALARDVLGLGVDIFV